MKQKKYKSQNPIKQHSYPQIHYKKHLDYRKRKRYIYLKKRRMLRKFRLFLLIFIIFFSGFIAKKLLNMYKNFTTPIPTKSIAITKANNKKFNKYSKFTVTIDPGHGGYDVGIS